MGIFNNTDADPFVHYDVTAKFRDKLMGATPKDPRILEAWLRTKTGVTQEIELAQMMRRTLTDLGYEVDDAWGYEELVEASTKLAGLKNTNGFKLDPEGPYIESRTIKAMLKEGVAILYPYQLSDGKGKWGPTKKAARSMLAERVFVDPDRIYMGVSQADGVELFIGHTSGPSGPQSNLTYHEYCWQPTLHFQVRVAEDLIPLEAWPRIWNLCQENGLGALRSQGFGRFDIVQWDRRAVAKPNKPAKPSDAEAAG